VVKSLHDSWKKHTEHVTPEPNLTTHGWYCCGGHTVPEKTLMWSKHGNQVELGCTKHWCYLREEELDYRYCKADEEICFLCESCLRKMGLLW